MQPLPDLPAMFSVLQTHWPLRSQQNCFHPQLLLSSFRAQIKSLPRGAFSSSPLVKIPLFYALEYFITDPHLFFLPHARIIPEGWMNKAMGILVVIWECIYITSGPGNFHCLDTRDKKHTEFALLRWVVLWHTVLLALCSLDMSTSKFSDIHMDNQIYFSHCQAKYRM